MIIWQTTMMLRKFHSFSLVVASIGWFSWMHIYCASFVVNCAMYWFGVVSMDNDDDVKLTMELK